LNDTDFYPKLKALPEGADDVIYNGRRYLCTKSTLLDGKLIKLYAEELGGNNIVSGNYYVSIRNGMLKPCEMEEKKVIDFVLNAEISQGG